MSGFRGPGDALFALVRRLPDGSMVGTSSPVQMPSAFTSPTATPTIAQTRVAWRAQRKELHMTDSGITPDASAIPDPDAISPDKVVVVAFSDDSKAYEALATVKQLDGQGQIDLVEAEIVTRDPDGRVHVKDEAGDDNLVGTASGGLIGLVIGILGGPFGVLLGGATGLLLGSLWDLDDADTTESALSEVSKTVRVGRNSLLAQVVEQSPDVLDAAMARLSGTVVRRPVYEIEAEIARAQEAQRDAKQQARAKLREARHEKNRADVHAKVEELKSKLHREHKPSATTS
jgi:uncharacterized membrane protein